MYLRTALGTVLALSWALPRLYSASPSHEVSPLLSTPVSEFQFHGKKLTGARGHIVSTDPGDLVEAVGNLAVHTGLRICTEALPARGAVPTVPVEITARAKTVAEILQATVKQDPRYEYEERLGVIEVRPVGADKDPRNCLNTVIPELRVNYQWTEAWGAIRCELELLSREHKLFADPVATGLCQPRRSLPHPPDQLIRASFARAKLRDIADQLVALGGNVAWVAEFRQYPRTCDNMNNGSGPGSGLAVFQPRSWYPKDHGVSEGLPAKCRACHYHR